MSLLPLLRYIGYFLAFYVGYSGMLSYLVLASVLVTTFKVFQNVRFNILRDKLRQNTGFFSALITFCIGDLIICCILFAVGAGVGYLI